jgi:hypothetical protein
MAIRIQTQDVQMFWNNGNLLALEFWFLCNLSSALATVELPLFYIISILGKIFKWKTIKY